MGDVEAFRRRFDSLADVIPAHLTLVFPFESDISNGVLRPHARSAIRGLKPFRIELWGASCTWDHYLILGVTRGADEIRELHDRLYTGPLRAFLRGPKFVPHVTVGRHASAQACVQACAAVGAAGPRAGFVAPALRVYDLTPRPYRVAFEVGWP